MKLLLIVSAIPAFQKLSQQNLPLQLVYSLKKLTDLVQTEVTFFEEQKLKILEKYGEDKNGVLEVKKEHEQEADKEYHDLLNTETTVEFNKFYISLEEKIELSISDMTALEPFIGFK